jgi:cytochrome c peroxidase
MIAAIPPALWSGDARALTPIELLGKNVFFDTNLSRPRGKQACASCHDAARGGVFPNAAVNLRQVAAPGAVAGTVGKFKTPTNAYATLIPTFSIPTVPVFLPPGRGGVFWDGRAEGCGKTGGSCPVGGGGTSATITELDLPELTRALHKRHLGPVAD